MTIIVDSCKKLYYISILGYYFKRIDKNCHKDMPLLKPRKNASKSTRRKAASKNISTEIAAGKPRKQAIAIGLNAAGLSRKKKKKPRK